MSSRDTSNGRLQTDRQDFWSRQETLTSLFEAVDDLIYVADGECNIEYVSPAMRQQFGPPDGKKCHEYVRGIRDHCEDCPLDRVFKGEKVRWQFRCPLNDRVYDVIDAPLPGPNRRPLAVKIMRDITEQEQQRYQLEVTRRLLEEKYQDKDQLLRATMDRLKASEQDRSMVKNALWESQQKYRILIEHIPAITYLLSSPVGNDATIEYISPQVQRILGYPADGPQTGMSVWREWIHPDDRDRVLADYDRAIRTGEPLDSEFRMLTVDGRAVWMHNEVTWVHSADGKPLFLQGILYDISEAHSAREQLRRSEEKFRRIIESNLDGYARADHTGRFLDANPAFQELTGYSEEELRGLTWRDLTPEKWRSIDEERLQQLHHRDFTDLYEKEYVRKDGQVIPIELRRYLLRGAQGEPREYWVFVRDISDRKQKEQLLHGRTRQLEQHLQLLNLARDSITIHDLDGRITFWNHGAEITYGWSRELALGKNSHILLKTNFRQPLMNIMTSLLRDGRWDGEIVQTTRNGKQIVVSSRWALCREEDGKPSAILEICTDVTRRRQLEEETQQARLYAESIIDTVQEALVVLSPEMKILSANKTFHETFHVEREKIRDRSIFRILQGCFDLPQLRNLIETILPQNTSFENYPMEYESPDRGRRHLLLHARRIYQKNVQTQLILLGFQDVTVVKTQEERLRIAQDRLRILTEELLMAEELQRERVATALHDSIGQILAFSKRELSAVMKKAPPEMTDSLRRVFEQIDGGVQEVRSLTMDLSTPTLHMFGLEAAVEELADDFTKQGEFKCIFQSTDEPRPLSKHIRTLLYRSVRELLINIAKHAEATQVTIDIQRNEDSIAIELEDDGKGFDTSILHHSPDQRPSGFGLMSVQERITHVGGRFQIESVPGKGTWIRLEAPLQTTPSASEQR